MKRRTLAHWAASRLSTSQVTMNPSRELGRCCRTRFTDPALIMDYAQLSITRSSINTPWREMCESESPLGRAALSATRPSSFMAAWPSCAQARDMRLAIVRAGEMGATHAGAYARFGNKEHVAAAALLHRSETTACDRAKRVDD